MGWCKRFLSAKRVLHQRSANKESWLWWKGQEFEEEPSLGVAVCRKVLGSSNRDFPPKKMHPLWFFLECLYLQSLWFCTCLFCRTLFSCLCIMLDILLREDCCLQSHCSALVCAFKILPCITKSSKHCRLNLPAGLTGGLLSVWACLGSWPAPKCWVGSLSRKLSELGTELWLPAVAVAGTRGLCHTPQQGSTCHLLVCNILFWGNFQTICLWQNPCWHDLLKMCERLSALGLDTFSGAGK